MCGLECPLYPTIIDLDTSLSPSRNATDRRTLLHIDHVIRKLCAPQCDLHTVPLLSLQILAPPKSIGFLSTFSEPSPVQILPSLQDGVNKGGPRYREVIREI